MDLPKVASLARGPDPGTTPHVHREDGRVYVHYRRPRLYLDRSAWEALTGPDDVLVQRVSPTEGPAFTIALTRAELERTFGEVRQTVAWETVRCYHFPTLPPAVAAFRVGATAQAVSPPTVRRPAPAPLPPMPAICTPIHEWAAVWAKRIGGSAESAAYLASVSAWRDVWRPDEVRVLLIAESHVAELPSDNRVRVQVPGARRALPSSYCRLVYCLGYGESALCSPALERNSGTPQFWDIFGAIAGGVRPQQPRKSESLVGPRVQWKLDVLEALRDRGIWLVDACVSGVYRPGGVRALSGSSYDQIVQESFRNFVWPSVAKEPIEQTWIIGAGVRNALVGQPGVRGARCIVQPQGDRGTGRHARELAEMVEALRR